MTEVPLTSVMPRLVISFCWGAAGTVVKVKISCKSYVMDLKLRSPLFVQLMDLSFNRPFGLMVYSSPSWMVTKGMAAQVNSTSNHLGLGVPKRVVQAHLNFGLRHLEMPVKLRNFF